ncbi:hypothetical protein Fmac_015931 [Flemingia macrophylla]|uniref:Uncharacterized protein n=1 Tax=Flemingia macrophylla TaxID=520843 RepID=A0ABD1MFY7_9FABA
MKRALLFLKLTHLWPTLKSIAQAQLQAHLLTFLSQETSIHVHRLSSLLTETLATAFQARQPPTSHLLDFLISSLTSDTDNLRRKVAALVLANLPHDVRLVLSNSFREKRGAVKALHASFLSSITLFTAAVQVASFTCHCRLILHCYHLVRRRCRSRTTSSLSSSFTKGRGTRKMKMTNPRGMKRGSTRRKMMSTQINPKLHQIDDVLLDKMKNLERTLKEILEKAKRHSCYLSSSNQVVQINSFQVIINSTGSLSFRCVRAVTCPPASAWFVPEPHRTGKRGDEKILEGRRKVFRLLRRSSVDLRSSSLSEKSKNECQKSQKTQRNDTGPSSERLALASGRLALERRALSA